MQVYFLSQFFNNLSFDYTYFLVDGIYPQYSCFVKAIREPITVEERCFAAWQESCRKDIERAFGVLKNTWQFMGRPILMMDLGNISRRVTTCLILHNMLVSDRVMENCVDRYNPSLALDPPPLPSRIPQPENLESIQQQSDGPQTDEDNSMEPTPIAIRQRLADTTRIQLLRGLDSVEEHGRLYLALSGAVSRLHSFSEA
jgi:Plant transposon protein